MKIKGLLKKATAIVLSASMVFSVEMATNVKKTEAAETTKASERVATLFDMKDATVDGELSIDLGSRHLTAQTNYFIFSALLSGKGELEGFENLYYSVGFDESVKDYEKAYFYYATLDDVFGSTPSEQQKEEYTNSKKVYDDYVTYLASKGIGTLDKKGNYYIPDDTTATVSVNGTIKDNNNFDLDLSLALLGSDSVKLTNIKGVDGELHIDVESVLGYAAFLFDTTKQKVVKKMGIPISVSGFEIEVFSTLYGLADNEVEEFETSVNNGNSPTERERISYMVAKAYKELCEKLDPSGESFGLVGQYFFGKLKDVVELAGLAVDGTYAKYSKATGDVNEFSVTEDNFVSAVVSLLTDVQNNSKDMATIVKNIAHDFVEKDDQENIDATIDGFIESFIGKEGKINNAIYTLTGKDSNGKDLTGEDLAEYQKNMKDIVELFDFETKITSSLTGEAGARDYEVEGNVLVAEKKDPYEGGKVLAPSEISVNLPMGLDFVKANFSLSVKEPNAGKVVEPESKLDGPAVGKKVTDKKYNYKVTKQGGTNGTVGELQVTGLKKKSITSAKIAAVVKIGGISYKVTSIKAKAFKGNKKFTKITIGKNVKTIGANAFAKNVKVKKITINSTVLKSIGKGAFTGTKALTKVIIKSNKLKKVGSKAFYRKKGAKVTFVIPKKKAKAYKKLLKKAKTNKYKIVKK